MRSFLRVLMATAEGWLALMCGVFSVVFTFVLVYLAASGAPQSASQAWQYLLSLSALAFIISVARVVFRLHTSSEQRVRDAQNETAALQRRIDELESRGPRIAITGVSLTETLSFLVYVKVANPGERTSVEGWTLEVRRPDGMHGVLTLATPSAHYFDVGHNAEIGVTFQYNGTIDRSALVRSAHLTLQARDIRGHRLEAEYDVPQNA